MTSLSAPLTLPCGAVLNNRIAKSAMTEGLADPNDNATQALATLYSCWSDGGAGLLLTGNVMVDRRYLERAGNVVLDEKTDMSAMQRYAQAGTQAGNHLWMQLSHPGRQCPRMVNAKPMSPSDVQLDMLGNFARPQPMTENDIEQAIANFARSALLAKQAGFTGVQIHCAHGYLISQFLSPLINKRDDQWGGSLENRARLARRIVQAVRLAVGDAFPIAVKLNSADFQKGGFSLEECQQVAAWLAVDGIDLLEISGGTYEQLSLLGVEPTDVRESTRKREAYFLEYAEAIKAKANVPIMITGGFRSRGVMEQALAKGEVDCIGLARPLCTHPDAPKHLISGELDKLADFEQKLVLGKGIWGNNSSLNLIKAINSFGQVGFYYWQIIRLSQGLQPQTELGVFRAFCRHMLNDLRLNLRRKSVRT